MWLGPAPEQTYNENRVHYNWRFIRDFGTGEMGNWGAHWLDVVHWFLDLDFPIAAMGTGGQYVVKDSKEWPDTQTVLYEYPALTVAWELRLWTRFGANQRGSGAEFGGDKGSLIVTRGGWTFYPKEGEAVEHGSSEMEIPHAVNFADAVYGDAQPAASMLEGHKSAAMCHFGNICTDLNRRIAFDPVSQTFGSDTEANAHLGRTPRAPWSLG
jgi:predicted dehydrogenase